MKILINSLQENAAARLKNPLIGAFIFSWAILNISDIMLFILESNNEKIAMVKNHTFNLNTDLLLPFVTSIIYLFAIPVLNMLYEFVVDGFINKHRNAFKQKNLQTHYYLVKRTTIAKLDSDEEENRKLRDKQLDSWIQEKKDMSDTIIKYKAEYSKRMAKIDTEIASYREQLIKTTTDLYELGENEQIVTQEIKNIVRDISIEVDKLKNISNLPDTAFIIAKNISTTINRSKKMVNMPLIMDKPTFNSKTLNNLDFDDDIPF